MIPLGTRNQQQCDCCFLHAVLPTLGLALLVRRIGRWLFANFCGCTLAKRRDRNVLPGRRRSTASAGPVRIDLEERRPQMDAAAFCALSKFDCCSQCRNANTRRATTLRMTTTRAVWFFIVALTAIRLSMLATTDLEFDEAHYWMWSERLAPAYFSKGPGIAFAIRSSTAIFGATEFGVRFWSPILGAGTSLLVYYFTRRLFNATTGFWAVLAMNAIPLTHVGNLLMT